MGEWTIAETTIIVADAKVIRGKRFTTMSWYLEIKSKLGMPNPMNQTRLGNQTPGPFSTPKLHL